MDTAIEALLWGVLIGTAFAVAVAWAVHRLQLADADREEASRVVRTLRSLR